MPDSPERSPRRRLFGTIALVLGAAALLAAVAHFWLGPIEPSDRSLESAVAETAARIKESLAAKLRGEEVDRRETPREFDADDL
ncbi:MAG: hypothetical protein KDB80_06665, partial [Planctomycetes bacterium]|nr:hypothetical protein [Planctomycetota bacterium]